MLVEGASYGSHQNVVPQARPRDYPAKTGPSRSVESHLRLGSTLAWQVPSIVCTALVINPAWGLLGLRMRLTRLHEKASRGHGAYSRLDCSQKLLST